MRTTVKIGFVIPAILPYGKVMASTRLRGYDVIRYLRKRKIDAGLYNPFLNYDIVIFQKAFSAKFLRLAEKLKRKNTKVIFDINVNYIDADEQCVTAQQRQDVKTMLHLADCVIAPSPYLRELYSRFHQRVEYVGEIIEERFFSVLKKHSPAKETVLLYCGYADKASELYRIREPLNKLRQKFSVKILLIAEKDPKLSIDQYQFQKYRQQQLPQLLLKGDIKIAPRDLARSYNLGHTFTKIGYPMAVGLPVVASPVPAYEGSPAYLCKSDEEWVDTLFKLISDPRLREQKGKEGQDFVRKNFSEGAIIPKYEDIFRRLIG